MDTATLQQASGHADQFFFFWKPEGFACQWHPSRFIEFATPNIVYLSAEHYMMFQKAKLFRDDVAVMELLELIDNSPIAQAWLKHEITALNMMRNERKWKEWKALQKALQQIGRGVKGFDPVIWDQNKLAIVTQGNRLKFGQSIPLNIKLQATSDRIMVEASPYDKVWGIGYKESDPQAIHPEQWRGKNLLGQALMIVRKELQQGN